MSALPAFAGQQGTVGVMARAQGIRAGIQAQGGLLPFIKSKTMGTTPAGTTSVAPTAVGPVTTTRPVTSLATMGFPKGFVIK